VEEGVRRTLEKMDEKSLRFLRLMREQVRGKNSREVHSGQAARELRIAPGSIRHSEYEVRLRDLVQEGHVEPHPERAPTELHRYLITDKGIAAADEPEPRSAVEAPTEEPGDPPTPSERPWWRRMFGG
jgi:hypothetical protein